MILLVAAALAGGLHAGIPVAGVPGVTDPAFQTPATGWTASVDDGWIRVHVGVTEAESVAWYARTLATLGAPPAPYALAGVDEAHGDGTTLVAFRDGNVGVLVRVGSGARAVAERLRDAIVDAPAPSVAPRAVQEADGTWRCEAAGALAVTAEGGRPAPLKPGAFVEAPKACVAWDAYGRAVVAK